MSTLPEDIDCMGRTGRFFAKVHDDLPIAGLILLALAELVFYAYREWVIWTR